jgi:hypothetical protein
LTHSQQGYQYPDEADVSGADIQAIISTKKN